MSPHGGLGWRDAFWALTLPIAYVAYAMIRGAADGWYAYWFLDPSALAAGLFAFNIAVLLAAFSGVALALVAIDKMLARRAMGETMAQGSHG
jgi:hypothetical protein